MSQRVWTLPDGLGVQETGNDLIEIKWPRSDRWLVLAIGAEKVQDLRRVIGQPKRFVSKLRGRNGR